MGCDCVLLYIRINVTAFNLTSIVQTTASPVLNCLFYYNIVLCITLCVCSVFRKYLDLFSFSALYCIIDIILTGFNKNFGYQYTHNNPQWQWFLLGWTQIYIWIITQIQIFILKNTDAFCGYRLQHILINTLEGIWNPVSNLALTARWLSY